MNQNPIGLLGEENLYSFAPNTIMWTDQLGCSVNNGLWGEKGLRIFSEKFTHGGKKSVGGY